MVFNFKCVIAENKKRRKKGKTDREDTQKRKEEGGREEVKKGGRAERKLLYRLYRKKAKVSKRQDQPMSQRPCCLR